MIKLSDLQPGDIIMAEFEGQQREGVVKEVSHGDKKISVETEIQDFWFDPEHLFPIPVTDDQLQKLGFKKVLNQDGTVKYMKDSFRIMLPKPGDFDHVEMWWREDRRHWHEPMYVHELQNHYYEMTKVELNPA